MTEEEKREELIAFLDRKAFDPILSAAPERFTTEHQREIFEDVRRSTESEKKRFHDNYTSASSVRDNYLSDLTSATAAKKNRELEELHLPRLPQFRDEFIALCKRLGV